MRHYTTVAFFLHLCCKHGRNRLSARLFLPEIELGLVVRVTHIRRFLLADSFIKYDHWRMDCDKKHITGQMPGRYLTSTTSKYRFPSEIRFLG